MKFNSIDMGSALPGMDEILAVLDTRGFSLLMDRMTDGIIVVDADNCLRAINNAALNMNNTHADDVLGAQLQELVTSSALDWGEQLAAQDNKRRQEFIASSEDGRSILVSLRYLRDADGDVGLTLIFMRDLQVFDHMRRSAAGSSGGNVFKFMADRDIGADFETQRYLSADVERMIVRGSRAMHQGARLLLLGESGSGKTELAKYLHRTVGTPEEAFVHVNCGAIPDSLFESEMFGYEKGAFTGALQTGQRGLIESAEGGTLFLDEIGEVPLSSQAKLLKFLEDGVIQRIGGRSGKKVNTRVVSATNRDLWHQVTEGHFRNDLYYRLAVITLEVTPLRQQPKLVRHLVDHFVSAANRMRKPKMRVSEDCLAALGRYSFPGNIRELHNLIQHLSVAADEEARPEHLPSYVLRGERDDTIDTGNQNETGPTQGGSFKIVTMSPRSLKEQVKEFERALIDNAIDRLGSKRKAARALGVDIGTIVRKTQGGPAPPRRH
jgi:transcriptional regulator with PAS, ATPase and Fis domain